MRPTGFHHLAIQVFDLPRAEAFYRETLGLSVLRRWPAASGPGERAVWLDTGSGGFIALERRGVAGAPGPAAGAPPPAGGLHLVALRIEASARAAWEDRFATAGVEVYDRTPYTIYVRDPEGNRVGLSHHPVAVAVAAAVAVDVTDAVDHV